MTKAYYQASRIYKIRQRLAGNATTEDGVRLESNRTAVPDQDVARCNTDNIPRVTLPHTGLLRFDVHKFY